MAYKPNPIDLSGIDISDELQTDIELISRNVHETWSSVRMKQGWVYGEADDPAKKTHHLLIGYDELPEEERDVDRATVTSTVKMLEYLGYEIKKKEKIEK